MNVFRYTRYYLLRRCPEWAATIGLLVMALALYAMAWAMGAEP